MLRDPTRLRALRGRPGVTLIEVLISTALFSLVMTGIYMLYTTMQGTLSRGEMKTDLQQSARIGMNRMVREIRMLGYDPQNAIASLPVTNPPLGPIRAASPSCLSFVSYYNDTDPGPAVLKSVQVTYYLSGTTLQRRQDPWTGSTFNLTIPNAIQPQAEMVTPSLPNPPGPGLTFTYYDRYNAILSPSTLLTYKCPPGSSNQPSSQLDYYQIREVRRVAITLQTQGSPFRALGEFYTLTSDVYLRNR
jgi:prepilin-type N-terminal cleavage/methylation domain-containing protein